MADTPSVSEKTGIRSYEEFLSTRAPKNELGKNEFLALLSAQLQYQDPLEPQKDTDFIAQLAQFSSLTYLQTLSQTMTTYQQFDLAGKYVYAEVTLDSGEKAAIRGLVDRVVISDGKAYAQVGQYMIDCSKISQVFDKDLFTGNSSLLDNANLIGKYLQAHVPSEKEGGDPEIVTGKCVRVSVVDGVLVAFLKTESDTEVKVGIADIFDVSESEITKPEDDGKDADKVVPGGTGESDDTSGDTDDPSDDENIAL